MFKNILVILLLFSCSKKFEYDSNDYKQLERIEAVENLIELRKEQVSQYDLNSKYEIILNRFKSKFLLYPTHLVIRSYNANKTDQIAVIDETAFYLFYLSQIINKTNFNEVEREIYKVISDIYKMDEVNGFDGFLPKNVGFDLVSNSLKQYEGEIHSNNYSILMFGYSSIYQNVENPKIRSLISDHVTMVAKRYIENDLKLVDETGKEIEVSNLRTRHLSRELDALVIFEVAANIANNQKDRDQFELLVSKLIEKKYIRNKKKVHFKLFNFQIPSHSSNWLNLLRLYTLANLTDKKVYMHNFDKLHNVLKVEYNPFFDALSMSLYDSDSQNALHDIKYYLETFPIAFDNSEIISSYLDNIDLEAFPRYTKNLQEAEVTFPLPIYQRPLVYFEWKANQRRVDGNFNQSGDIEFSGLDFLVLYSMYKNLVIE